MACPFARLVTPRLIWAALGVLIVPAVLGVLGVAAGMVAVVKDARWRGAVVVNLSASGPVVGYYWAAMV